MAPNDNVTPQPNDNSQAPTMSPISSTTPISPAPDVQANPAAPSMPTAAQAPPSAQDIAKRALSSPVKAFAAGILQHLAGPPPEVYSTDENGKTTAVPEHRTTGGAVRSLAANALAGLAAGAQVQTRKSGAASALAGIGAGAGAVTAKLSAADQLARTQSKEDFETEQRAMVQKSNVAHLNAATMSTYFGNIKAGNDLDPVFAQNHSLVDAINDSPELGHAFVMTSEEADRARENDHHFVSDNVLLPLGRVPKLDGEGNPVLDPTTKQPLTTFQIAVIPGHDGKLVVPQSLVDDVQKYGDRAGIGNADAITAGSEISFNKVIPMMAAVQAEKKAELAGWQKATDVLSEDGKTHKQMNPVTGEVREYPAKIQPNVKNEAAESAATVGEKNATASEVPSKITKNLAEAGAAKAKTAAGGTGNVLAFDPANKTWVLTTPDEVEAKHFTNTSKVAAKDIGEFEQSNRTLNNVQQSVNQIRGSVGALDQNAGQRTIISKALAHQAGTTYDQLLTAGALANATEQTKAYVQNVYQLRESVLAMNKMRTGQARMSEQQGAAVLAQIPGVSGDSKYAGQQLEKFQNTLSGLGQGVPQVPGVDRIQPDTVQQTSGHKVGYVIVQDGQSYTITSVDKNGKVTGAQ